MKKIFLLIIEFIRNDIKLSALLSTALIIGVGIYLNYGLGFKREYLNADYGEFIHYLKYFLFTAIPYSLVLIVVSLSEKNFDWVGNKKFWIKIIAAWIILTINGSSKYLISDTIRWLEFDRFAYSWLYYLGTNLHRFIVLGFLLYIFKILFDKDDRNFYGTTLKNFDPKPYFTMLLVMLPLIIWASFQPSFQKMYPIYSPGSAENLAGYSHWLTIGTFEFFYGLRFVVVEIFFRGFLVIGFIKILGPRAILPVVITYAFWHFGKPMPETIGSVFGGFILGIIALRTGSVFGGIIAHMGVALMMEAAAYAQILSR